MGKLGQIDHAIDTKSIDDQRMGRRKRGLSALKPTFEE